MKKAVLIVLIAGIFLIASLSFAAAMHPTYSSKSFGSKRTSISYSNSYPASYGYSNYNTFNRNSYSYSGYSTFNRNKGFFNNNFARKTFTSFNHRPRFNTFSGFSPHRQRGFSRFATSNSYRNSNRYSYFTGYRFQRY